MRQFRGRCLCQSVRFAAQGTVTRISACYCSQCTRQNGGGPFYGVELHGQLSIEQGDALRWFDSSVNARRGFCGQCGTSLFWQKKDSAATFDISIGTLDDHQLLTLDAHIFVDGCPPYIAVPDTAPHFSEADVTD